MIKDLNKIYIIEPDDSRYGLLGHLIKKYNISYDYDDKFNLIRKSGNKSYEYAILGKLVINNYITNHLSITKDHELNWIDCRSFKRVILLTCNLTDQDYFDLFYYKNNKIIDRPRCANRKCRKLLNFSNLLRGYNSGGRLIGDLIGDTTCSQSCFDYYRHQNKLIYGDHGFRNKVVNAKTKMSWFNNRGELTDECYLYIKEGPYGLKYGITSDIDQREYRYLTHEKDPGHLEIIFKGERLLISKLEYKLKEIFNYSEYINISKSDFINLFNKLINSN